MIEIETSHQFEVQKSLSPMMDIPGKSGSGAMVEASLELAKTVMEIYDASNDLITAVEKLLRDTGIQFEESDQSAAQIFQ